MKTVVKVTFICPKWGHKGLTSVRGFMMPPMGILELASITPKEWEIEIVDENVRRIDFNKPTDLVALTGVTALAPRAYEIAKKFSHLKIPTIMGGIHASMCPGETGKWVDSVVIGEADEIWPKVLKDAKKGKLKKFYQVKKRPDLSNLPPITRRVPTKTYYPLTNVYMTQTSRGCPINCDFCSVTQFNGKVIRHRPIEKVIQEVKYLTSQGGLLNNFLFFTDDNIVADLVYAKKLFAKLKPLSINWLSQTDIRIALNRQLLKLAVNSGLTAVFIGFESLDKDSLAKEVSQVKAGWRKNYEEAIKRLHDLGIFVEGAFVFGLDSQDKSVFEKTVEWAIKNNIDAAQFTIATPFPGTTLFRRLAQQGRITAKNPDGAFAWEKFNAMDVVFEPAQMTQEELSEGFWWAYKTFYSYSSIAKRLLRAGKKRSFVSTFFTAFVNWDFRHFKT
jgi:radical SAM superfamily enzyme YgiQ (UPF0313 family)